MLVLTRRPGEQIVIGNGIRLTVVSVGPGRVKLGIEAPADVRIDRQEVHAKIQQEQAESSADVLAQVGRLTGSEEPSPTIVSSGDTSTLLRNRIAEKLSTPDTTPSPLAPVPAVAAEAPVNRVKHRLPNKPR
jgi:carbon storage regulator